MVVTSPLLALALLVAVPTVVLPTRWLWRFLPGAMTRMLDAWAGLASRVHESTAGARTLDALGLVERRVSGDDAALVAGVDRERDLRALHVRWTPWLEIFHVLPLAAMLALGAWAHAAGLASLGEVTTMVVYVQALATPLDKALWWVEDLMVATVALRRVLGVRVPDAGRGYVPAPRPGERGLHLEGSGSPTGPTVPCCAGSTCRPAGRTVDGGRRVGGGEVDAGPARRRHLRPDVGLGAPRRARGRRTRRRHAARRGAAADPGAPRVHRVGPRQPGAAGRGVLRRRPAGGARLVGLGEWFATLPDGLDTAVGAGAATVPAPVAQQLALARVVLADPGTVVLDEATSLLDTASARRTEGALDRVLAGRTVMRSRTGCTPRRGPTGSR